MDANNEAIRPQTLMDCAVEYGGMGLAVIPLCPRIKDAAIKKWPQLASTDPIQIAQWWSENPNYNVGIVCGSKSGGLVVIDVDVDPSKGEDGRKTLEAWEAEHGKLPETATTVSGRGGHHYLYRLNDQVFRNSRDETPTKEVGIDIRGEGGYFVAPPSIHPNGSTYQWLKHPYDTPIAQANDNVIAFIKHVQKISKVKKSNDNNAHFTLPEVLREGTRDTTLFEWACSERARNTPKDVTLAALRDYNTNHCKPPLDDAIVVQKVESAYKYEPGQRPKTSVYGIQSAIEQDLSIKDGAGRTSIAFNAFVGRRWVVGFLPWDQSGDLRPWMPEDDVQAFAYLQSAISPKVSRQNVADALTLVERSNQFDPLKDLMLNDPANGGLPEWDGQKRVRTMLVDLLGAEDSKYLRHTWGAFMCGAFMRAIRPGWKVDLMPVLFGRQGVGKSTFCELLAIRPEWYLDGPRDLTDVANSAREMGGRLICEQSELANLRRQDVEAIKAAITRERDVYIEKYQVTATERPRRAVLIGTTNTLGFLRDSTGNRRFLPYEVGVNEPKVDLFSEDARHYIIQAWAELATTYRANGNRAFKTHLSRDDEAMAEQIRARFTEVDDLADTIGSWLDEYAKTRVCAQQVAVEALGFDTATYQRDKRLQIRIAEALDHKCQGWVRSKSKQRCGKYGTRQCWERAQ